MAKLDRDALIATLSRLLAQGELESRHVLPALRELASGASGVPTGDLIEALDGYEGKAVRRLVKHLGETRRRHALACHRLEPTADSIPAAIRASLGDLPLDVPRGWATSSTLVAQMRSGLDLVRDLSFARRSLGNAPGIATALDDHVRATARERRNLWRVLVPLDLARTLEDRLDTDSGTAGDLHRFRARLEESQPAVIDSFRATPELCADTLPASAGDAQALDLLARLYEEAATREEKSRLLDTLCSWPTDRAAEILLALPLEPWAQERVDLILKIRFGATQDLDGSSWRPWLEEHARESAACTRELETALRAHAGELLFLWSLHQGERDPATGAEGEPQAQGDHELASTLRRWCDEHVEPTGIDEFVERWGHVADSKEWSAVSAPPPPRQLPTVSPVGAKPAPVGAKRTVTDPVGEAVVETEASRDPPSRRRSELWESHLQPFFVENWYMVAGVAMVLVGASLLSFYTWDKYWLLRYTIMPGLLATFTATLAGVARWIEARGEEFRGTAAVLRGAAIGLLPVNFMTVALLSGDEDVAGRIVAVPAMGAVYALLAAWGLSRWCAATHPQLKWLLGGTLLITNALVIVGPITRAASGVEGRQLLPLLGCGFYVGFVVIAIAVIRFSREVLTRKLAEDRRVPWFFGATLVLTFVQVFAWVHASMRSVTDVWMYAPMVVLSGWLVLYVERRALQLRETPDSLGKESFLGFALILLGVFMGAAHEYVRIVVFALAGIVWIYQSRPRRQQLHDWIGLTFVALAVASIGLVDGFPGVWLPSLGIAAVIVLGAIGVVSRWIQDDDLSRASEGVQIVALALTGVIAALAQWHFHSPPLLAGVHLLVVVTLIGWRAYRDGRVRWVHTAMAVLGLALPYLGFVDVQGRTLQGNTMAFGLAIVSILWLVLIQVTRAPLLLKSRSTVLWIYGALAVAATILRVIIERGQPFEPL